MKLFWLLLMAVATVRAGAPAVSQVEPPAVGGDEPLRFASGARRTALVELYTSEGCSSCPPAERWLAGLREEPGLWRDFVPVAFHVNYWDNLGWPDRFASRQFTQRQYALAATWGGGSVYTPCFVCDGAEWHPSSAPGASDKIAGLLAVNYDPASGHCRVRFLRTEKSPGSYDAHVALLGGGLASNVTAGENEGVTLQHEFVALVLVDEPMRADGMAAMAELMLPQSKTKDAARRALAAWVTRRGELAPLQATGGWVP
ncbi:MAG TPA: DUF1223 domain-containing protein [Opitutaceae bacterium]|jgi:hypothetical protein|nr:DUF1223 domain-containing protein [Opitutaceae bacterium]